MIPRELYATLFVSGLGILSWELWAGFRRRQRAPVVSGAGESEEWARHTRALAQALGEKDFPPPPPNLRDLGKCKDWLGEVGEYWKFFVAKATTVQKNEFARRTTVLLELVTVHEQKRLAYAALPRRQKVENLKIEKEKLEVQKDVTRLRKEIQAIKKPTPPVETPKPPPREGRADAIRRELEEHLQSEVSIERYRKEAKAKYPEHAELIDRLCDDALMRLRQGRKP